MINIDKIVMHCKHNKKYLKFKNKFKVQFLFLRPLMYME